MSAVCVIGGGPSGSTFAARMAVLGHDVSLIERARFPRRHIGESLTPGVLSLLEMIGACGAVQSADFRRVSRVTVKWDQDARERLDPQGQGLLVDRGEFDQLLLNQARALGVRVLQPAVTHEIARDAHGWKVAVAAEGCTFSIHADFVADATGRSGALVRCRRPTGCRTFAVFAYWRGADVPDQPRIEASGHAWCWGVPLPGGTCNTLVFVDAERLQATRAGFLEIIAGSSLLNGRDAHLVSPVLTADATPYIDDAGVTLDSIKVGDAAVALDPLSSSGVQKAIQTSLSAAIVANTLLRKPESANAAIQFYRQSLADTSERHCRWAAEYYSLVAQHNDEKFWRTRSASGGKFGDKFGDSEQFLGVQKLLTVPEFVPEFPITGPVFPSGLEFVDMPCIEGDFVTIKPALKHPALESPVVYLGGCELAPLLKTLQAGMTPLQIAMSWSPAVPLKSGLAITGWLLNHRILVQR